MRYAQIRKMDISNGAGIGQSLFVQGCEFHCPGCFNEETWDLDGGNEWTPEIEEEFLELLERPYIIRVSILGGEPLLEQNLDSLDSLIMKIWARIPHVRIWLYTGYTYEEAIKDPKKKEIIDKLDYLVDGQFIEEEKDLTLEFRGSRNQRIIDIKQTRIKNKVVECNYKENNNEQ